MINHEFTGKSTTSYEEAISLALYAASEFLDNMKDAEVHIRDLHVDAEDSFCALLEITKDPMAPAYTEAEFEEDEKLGDTPNAEKKYQFYRRKGYASLKSLIADHFKKKGQEIPSGIPDFIIAHLSAVDIENNAIEKDFLFAAEAMPAPIIDEPLAGDSDNSDGEGDGDGGIAPDSTVPDSIVLPEPEQQVARAQPSRV